MSKDPDVSPETFAASLSARVLHCRELGHSWRPLTVRFDAKARVYDRQLRCSSCHTIRKQTLSRRGEVVSNGYQYPPRYLATNVSEHVDRALFRIEALTRFLEGSDGAAQHLKAV